MRIMKLTLLALVASMFSPLLAVDTISGTATAGENFSQNITGKAFDRYAGELYVGTAVATVPVANTIAKAGRSDNVFTGIGTATTLLLDGQMDIASTDGTGADYVAYKKSDDNAAGAVSVIPAVGGTEFGTTLDQIVDAAGAAATNISLLTGGYYDGSAGAAVSAGAYFFVRARTHLTDDFTVDGGIEALLVTEGTPNTFTVIGTNTDADAVLLDGTFVVGDNGSPLKVGNSVSDALPITNTVNDIHWDPRLNTLFTASTLTGTRAGQEIMAISKVKFQDDAAAKLIISNIYAEATHPTAGENSAIFALLLDDITTVSTSILKIRTMYTSTGNDYLIVNGGNGAVAAVGNKFWALRYDDETGYVCANDTDGTALVDGFKLTGVATDLDGGNVGSLTIGGGASPWPVDAPASDMEVIGDTVYVSYTGANRDATNDPGVWASTAQFDKDGVIISWTAWERVMPSQGDTFNDRTECFSVDAVNNKIWAVTQSAVGEPKKVLRTTWNTSDFAATSLGGKIATAFGAGTYSDVTCALDIPAGTRGLSAAITADYINSLALFGGEERVAFAVTRTADGTNQLPTATFNDDTFKDTTLENAGTVRSLGYSRDITNATHGYFLAGTDTGLWIWALTDDDKASQVGFNGSTKLTTLVATPFDGTFSWQHMLDGTDQISGPVTAIDSDGKYIYLIEQDVSSVSGTIISKLWKITINANVEDMETAAIVIAMSGKDEIPANAIFTDFKLITTDNAANDTAKCILSTNVGLYYPSIPLGTFVDADVAIATPNAPNSWFVKDADIMFPNLFALKRVPVGANDGINHMVIANALVDDSRGFNYFQNSQLRQYNSDATMTFPHLGMNPYTNTSMVAGTDTLTYLNNRALSFWTDGGRRFYTRRNASEKYSNASTFTMLNSFPLSAAEWNMSEPYGDDDIAGETIYWIESISGLGIIACGTPNGIITLE